MKKVYMIMVDEWTDGYVSTSIEGIHATLDGAKVHFREITWNETAHFIFKETGERDTSDETLEKYGIKKRTFEAYDGTMDFCIEYKPDAPDCGSRTFYVHIYEKDLLD
jgi:hypothetical protein